MFMGYTPGGSPIFFNNPRNGQRKRVGKPLFECSADSRHKLTKNQAKSKGYMCSMCGAPLKARQQKIAELECMANSLGFKIVPK